MVQTAPDRPLPARFTFAGFILDTGTRCLTRGGEPVPLSPKEFHALLILVQAGGHAVPHETLIRTIWPDTIVGDTSLGRIISVLRRHLGAEAIVSVARFGYRFAPDVAPLDSSIAAPLVPEPAVATTPVSPQHRWHLFTFAAAFFVASFLVAAGFTTMERHHPRRPLADSDAARWDALGLFALREGTYFKASKAFEQAIQLAPHKPLLHAHLADAWLQLNMDEAAREELLLASVPYAVQELSKAEQLYIEAVRATALRDYPSATRQYRAILESSQVQDRSDALQDLGRALQREGRLPEATAAYRQAAELQPSNAGVQLRLGLLAGLQRDIAAADRYLDRATRLYQASTNQEGEAEVDYQRASMAYVRADYTRAAMFYSASLDLATKLNDLQMEARALGGLSTVRRWQGDLPGSAEAANRVMLLARILHSDFWQAEAVMHLANISIARKAVPESRTLLAEALDLADRIQQPRLQANAEFSMADLADQTGDYTQELAMAQRARQHYESYGSADGVADASMQVIQAERGLHNYPAALHDAQALLDNSIRTGSDVFAEDTEAELGHIYSAMEDHAAALDHYQRALDLAHKTGSQVALKSLNVVCALAHLGRRQQAWKLYATIPISAQTDSDSGKRYKEARLMLQQPTKRMNKSNR